MPHDSAPATPRRRVTWRAAAVGVAAALLLGACTAGDDPADATPSPVAADGEPATAPEPQVDLGDAHGTGEAVEQERFTVTVAGFTCDGVDVEGVEASGRLCALTLEVANDTDTVQSLEIDQQVLLDDSGTEYGVSPEATEAAGTPEDGIEPGESRALDLLYDVPDGVQVVAARLSDAPGDGGTLVDLQG